ncbi:7-cyano-7-deazaguanine synthase QueC [Wenzhouxiangella sp. XN201]|uniref:7-cyano-7-deazaguanine synthase QueC n=1 Tax=Wenzhouxiangella sp. XN201 TaxID=2710755 RepID=UPI0013C78565|nr:7-cyano-7-deazaguanine synthase QueC [Wenzhouxiangella sp. XN201]NEZ02888.1 7-cyano-7-deazaguanine synthase QueC [Wenzhouxiangella sp. XN201]
MVESARRAVVLLSGGLDSATVLADAVEQGFECHTLAVDYGQRHTAELAAAERVATGLGAASHRVVRVDLRAIGGSALTDDIDVPESASEDIPVTYVPARNTLLLSLALGYAEVLGAQDLFIGVNAVDYSGYPDCRPQFVSAFEELAGVATRAGVKGARFRVHAPLIELSKAEIIRHGTALGVDYAQTVSCYQADENGRACGRCDSCRLRRDGFESAGVPDPTRYAARG